MIKPKKTEIGSYLSCPPNIKAALNSALNTGYSFIVTQITHPNFHRDLTSKNPPKAIGRTDRVLKSLEWGQRIIAELTNVEADSEIPKINQQSKAILLQELGFACHLGVPAVLLHLNPGNNIQLTRIINEKITEGSLGNVWVNLAIFPSSWNTWNNFRTLCNYNKNLGVVLELPPEGLLQVSDIELQRWIGEPIKALVIKSSGFTLDPEGKPTLKQGFQDIIRKFLPWTTRFIIRDDTGEDLGPLVEHLKYLAGTLHIPEVAPYAHLYEEFLVNPLQPLEDNLATTIYEFFENDHTKYERYQMAISKALEKIQENPPVVMVVGAGRGPFIQAILNVSYTTKRPIKIYAVEKNPYAINTLLDRVHNEWNNEVVLVQEDMRLYNPPELADIIVSELMGPLGDDQLSPECLDGAQRFLKRAGVSIPCTYTSFLAPIQSLKVFNEIRAQRKADQTLESAFERPVCTFLRNFYLIDNPKELFSFSHPNWKEPIDNQRYKKLEFRSKCSCVLTGFAGFFEAVLYEGVGLSIYPETHTPNMDTWFPIIFSLPVPIQVNEGNKIELSFWRTESHDRVWYEWCMEAPVKTPVMNPNGRSYFMKKSI